MRLMLFILIASVMPGKLVAQIPVADITEAPDWIEGLKNGKIPGWLYVSDGDMSALRASSNLQNFLPSQASDGRPSTAWAEGATGPGIDETLIVDFDLESTTWWIWAGYGKSADSYLGSNRPKQIRVYLLGTFCQECTPSYCVEGNFVVLNSIQAELLDRNEFQKLPLPEIRMVDNSKECQGIGGTEKGAENYRYKLAIQILSVYKGTNDDKTCISEVMDHVNYMNWIRRPRR